MYRFNEADLGFITSKNKQLAKKAEQSQRFDRRCLCTKIATEILPDGKVHSIENDQRYVPFLAIGGSQLDAFNYLLFILKNIWHEFLACE